MNTDGVIFTNPETGAEIDPRDLAVGDEVISTSGGVFEHVRIASVEERDGKTHVAIDVLLPQWRPFDPGEWLPKGKSIIPFPYRTAVPEILDELPVGTVIRHQEERDATVYEKWDDGWHGLGLIDEPVTPRTPAAILYNPDED